MAGLYVELQTQLDEAAWGYVSNPRGGFMGFWWNRKRRKYYLQLEQQELCVKIEITERQHRRGERDRWWEALDAVSGTGSLKLRKGTGIGGTMSVAVTEYLVTDSTGLIDIARSVEQLRSAEILMDAALNRIPNDGPVETVAQIGDPRAADH